MNTILTTSILSIFLLFIGVEYPKQNSQPLSEVTISSNELKMVKGEWTGSLTYMDYSSGNPYTMPANVSVKDGKNSNQLFLYYTYPNEPKANSRGSISISKNGRSLNKHTLKSKRIINNDQLEVVTEYEGKDNRKKALIRNVYIIGSYKFIIRKEVQFNDTNEWIKRNEYSFSR